MKRVKNFFYILCCISMNAGQLFAESNVDFEYELDAYYSNISWVIGFEGQEIPVISDLDELGIYHSLLKDSLTPDFLLFEVSINPMPILGTYIRKNDPALFEGANRNSPKTNVIKAVTAGFDEPFALSVFAGRVVRFAPPEGMKTKGDDKGYIGYLLSVGNQHIQQNLLLKDNWAELEWKIKGTRETAQQLLSWSVRGGVKFHSHTEVSDTLMVGIRRDRIDFTRSKDAFFHDIGFDYKLELLQKNLRPARQQLLLNKHWPLYQDKLTFSLEFGIIWQGDSLYKGSLAQTQEEWTVILRPNIRF